MKNMYWQKIRGVCVLAVILIHVLYSQNILIYDISNIIIRSCINFVVAVFVFIAGYFVRIDSTKDFYMKKIVRLIPPLIIWDVLYTLVYAISNDYTLTDLIKKFVLSSTCPQLYYIYVLIQLFAIAPFLEKYIKNIKSKVLLFIPMIITPLYNLVIVFLGIHCGKSIPLYQYHMFGWISYFYLGMLLRTKKIDISIKILIFSIIPLLCISICEEMIIYNNYNLYSIATSQITLFNSLYSIAICLLLYQKEHKSYEKNIISKIGDYSFGIYLSHFLFLKIVQKIMSLIAINYYLFVLLSFSATLFITFSVNYLWYKYNKNNV